MNTDREDYYITVSRLVPYKRIDLLVEAFSRTPERRLIIVGTGSNLNRCKEKAPLNVEFLGHQPDQVLKELLSRARAFVFAAEEDFGICIVEAMACGTPVICLGRGGALDIITPGETGIFFYSQEASSILEAILKFENSRENFDPHLIRAQAEKFSVGQFKERFKTLVTEEWARSKGISGNEETPQLHQTVLRSAVGK